MIPPEGIKGVHYFTTEGVRSERFENLPIDPSKLKFTGMGFSSYQDGRTTDHCNTYKDDQGNTWFQYSDHWVKSWHEED